MGGIGTVYIGDMLIFSRFQLWFWSFVHLQYNTVHAHIDLFGTIHPIKVLFFDLNVSIEWVMFLEPFQSIKHFEMIDPKTDGKHSICIIVAYV